MNGWSFGSYIPAQAGFLGLMKKTQLTVTILYPGGNTTAIVEGIPSSQLERKRINDAIMKQFPKVEQVGFLDRSKPLLQMAGGEFCGNATRSAACLHPRQ